MSLKEAPALHYLGKVGLKRKLTGPSQLLLGKWKLRYKSKNSSPRDKRPNSPNRESRNSMPNHNYSVQEMAQEPLGSTPNPLSSCKDSTKLESTAEPLHHSIKPDRDSASEQSKAQGSSRLKGWRRFFCHVFLCPRRLRFKPALGDEDQNHEFTFYNQQTRDSFDTAVWPSIIYQVIEQNVEQEAVVAAGTECTKTEQSFLKGLFCLRKKCFSSKPNHKSLDPAFVVQKAAPCPCLKLRNQFRHQMRHRAKKPSPFFQERIGSAHEYIQEETIVLSNRHTDEGVQSICQSIHDDGPHSETLKVSVDVTPVMSECESRSTLYATHAESCGKSSLHMDQEDSEYATLPEEETLVAGTNGKDEPDASSDVSNCQRQEEEENHAAVNVPESLVIWESSATSQVNQKDKAIVQKRASTVNEVGQTTSQSSPANTDIPVVFSHQCESGPSPLKEVMGVVDEILSCPVDFHGKHALDIKSADDGPLCKISDPQPPEVLLYQTARLLVQAAMETALRQLEKDLVDSVAGYYEDTGDY